MDLTRPLDSLVSTQSRIKMSHSLNPAQPGLRSASKSLFDMLRGKCSHMFDQILRLTFPVASLNCGGLVLHARVSVMELPGTSLHEYGNTVFRLVLQSFIQLFRALKNTVNDDITVSTDILYLNSLFGV